ncbi:MAG: DUF554 domain-containing protein [Anaerotignum sp.]|nr:DUF554 domain-containing protein [Anaerotignum sp.]MBP3627908.1 DUF554 domain-containing protein [Anaerotignum sp.]
MIGLGTIINVGAIVIGGLFGLFLGRGVKVRYQDILMISVGISIMMLGIGGTMEEMLSVQDGNIVSGGSMMMIITMAVGALIGEWMDIEGKMEKFGIWLKKKTGSSGDSAFVDAFVTCSLTVCIGAMAIVGSIKDGIYGDYTILAAKAILDLIIVFVMTVSMGKGCVFSAIPVGIFQGVITLLARLIQPLMTEAALSNLSLVGSIMIFCVGLNLVFGKKVKVANFLPAIVLAVAWSFAPWA